MTTRFDVHIVRDSIARPDNTTGYAAGDVISEETTNDHFIFTQCLREAGMTGTIDWVRLISSANVATKLDAELWLFKADIAEVADNSAFAPTDAEMLTLVAVIPLPSTEWYVGTVTGGAGGNAVVEANKIAKTFQSTSKNLYGQLVARNAYAPIAEETFTCEIGLSFD